MIIVQHFARISFALFISYSTVLSQLQVPQWAKDAVWYQIFPERFRNGDPTNDPTAADLELAAERGWSISPWTSDWYKLQSWEKKHSGNFYENVFERCFGGDLQGVLGRLDYLSDLGINSIYFNPVFEAISLHKYDAAILVHKKQSFLSRPTACAGGAFPPKTDEPGEQHSETDQDLPT